MRLQQNTINLILAGAILLLVTACFCRSDRNDGSLFDPPSERESSSNDNRRRQPDSSHPKDKGDFLVQHLDVQTPRYLELEKEIKDRELLESAATKLNKALALPHDIALRTKDCKEVNAFYDPNDRSITMCFELMEHFYKIFQAAGTAEADSYDKMFDAVQFVFLHEIGHALIDAYKLPVAGNEEDAADRLSAYVNLNELGEEGIRAIFAAADAFAIESKLQKPGKTSLAGEHLLSEQRFYNALCMIYGSDSAKYSRIVSEGYLPRERAVRCPSEYKRTIESWITLLEPWRIS